MGACAILPRIIGHGRAAELLFTGRSMSAEEGLAWGFCNRVVEDVLAEAQRACAASSPRGPTFAHAMTKRQLDAEWHVSIDDAIDDGGRGAGHLHEDQGFPPRLRGLRQQAEAGVPG